MWVNNYQKKGGHLVDKFSLPDTLFSWSFKIVQAPALGILTDQLKPYHNLGKCGITEAITDSSVTEQNITVVKWI